MALGATRRRLFVSLVVESVVLSLCAVGLALLVSLWGVGAAKASLPPGIRPSGSQPVLIRPIEDAFRNITARRRFSAGTMAIFGVLALLIGAVGVYGVMASIVAQRTREIGVRLALGASARQIVVVVLGQAARVVAIGLGLGLPLAWLVSSGFATLFFEVRPTDGWVSAFAGGVLAAAAGLAALAPARRAAQVDPLVTLRAE